MKNLFSIFLFALAVTLTSGLCAQDAKLTVSADSWMPYNGDPKDAMPGYMIECLQEIFGKDNVFYTIKPWTRSVLESRKGKVGSIVGATHGDAPDFIFPKEAFGKLVTKVYVKSDSSFKYEGIKSFDEVKLGVIDGYSYEENVDKYIAAKRDTNKIHVAKGNDALPKLIKMLKAGRVSAMLESPAVFAWTVKEQKHDPSLFKSAGDTGKPESIYIAFSPKNKKLSQARADKFDVGMKALRKSGKLKAILAKYGQSDWK